MTVRGATYERKPLDDYPTPPEALDVLFEHVNFGRVFDPACGSLLRVIEAAQRHGLKAFGTDIINGPAEDFFHCTNCGGYDVVTNPPFGTQGRTTLAFIEHALKITEADRCRVAMLLPVDFDSGKTRMHVFEHPAHALKIILTDRIKWFNSQAGSLNHAWHVWCHKHQGPPTLRYARIE